MRPRVLNMEEMRYFDREHFRVMYLIVRVDY
jgi:hypothetical protein